jgi:hypothetical protein
MPRGEKQRRPETPSPFGERVPPAFGRVCGALFFSRAVGAACVIFGASCASLRVPSADPVFEPSAWVSAEREGFELRAVPLEGRNRYWELFDENLPALGIVALWVEVRNGRPLPVSVSDAPWRLRVTGGERRALDAAQVLKRYHAQAGTRLYSPAAESETREKLRRLLLAPGDLAAGQSRAGFLFFAADPGKGAHWDRTATLIAPPIRCAGRGTETIELPLAYANP